MKKLFSHGYFRSIGFKIAFIIICVGIIPFVVCVPISMRAYESVSIRTDATNLMAQAISYNNQIVTSGYLTGDENSLLDTQLKAVAESYNGRILVVNSTLKIVRDSFSADVGKTVIWENIIYSMQGQSLYYYDKLTNYLIVTVPLTSSEGETVGVLVINKSMDYILTNEDTFLSYMLIGEIIIVSLTLIVAVFSHIHFTKPIKRMSKSLDAIVREYTSEMPEEDSFTELQDISSKFNEVIGKLHSIDESRQEFVSNVSHELKTPLTSMKVLADSLNGSEDVPIEMYKEFMLDIGDEIDRETKIINDLLSLVRMDKSGAQLNVTAVNINELIEHILKRLKPIAEKSDIEVVYESFRPVVAEVDEVKFTLVVTNLVENAIKYNNEGGWVHISLNSDHQFFYIKVEDNGLGIPEDSVEHIFERFYRADKSHSREIGGTGLGLAITKSAIAMHNGEIKVRSKLNEGSTFDVRIPLNYIEKEVH
ncbi:MULTISPECIES: sensor histidine kinase [Pseudobutyrivibrio]|uniref:histidine kinase n=2 Tax=Pseudobutyrivibrio ruminis TaxID=46206 RepID=A0A1H7I829_9FIRM|nr:MULTISPECIES: HAMP domain-containing sensor histidine kinase [Pseudobutyrivibrio]SEK58524.1 Signal transduction histidine kinase [Pseudobutyrivibrio ruminis]SES75266.1 Signal transduction histidine kinase [Pseudobutyrivibrio sp. C4]SFO29701.1 Signal transduction histidine kinase [Pseudobutyrivibrio sp. JW11]SOC13121.1 Signal transduction histidine kinase [Pseudobutyrivibrio ruminis DSM 9787]